MLRFSAIAGLTALLCAPTAGFAQSILQTAGNFALLGGTAVTSDGTVGTVITNGNVGSAVAVVGYSDLNGGSGPAVITAPGSAIVSGAVVGQAILDLGTAKVGLAGMASTATMSGVDLGGKTLAPGVYTFGAAASQNGALVLDAQGKNNVAWVFQIGTALSTGAGATVTVINLGSNGGADDGIFWVAQTGGISFGANNRILGNYLAATTISATTGANGTGGSRALSQAGVTLINDQINAKGGPGGSDWTGGLKFSGSAVVPTASASSGAPVITSPASAPGIAGTPFSAYAVAATGGPTSYSATGLPAGLTFNTQTGAISGTPTVAGTSVVAVTATNSFGTTSGTVTITVAAAGTVTPPAVVGSRILNFSARALSGPGDQALIMGFVVAGDNKHVLVRGVGPALAAFGVVNVLADPLLTLFGNTSAVAVNDNWQFDSNGVAQGTAIQAASAQVGAFALPAGSKDSALLFTLNNGAHTTGLVRPNGTTGVALTEIYDTDTTPDSRLINVSARMNVSAGEGTLIAGLVIAGNAPKTVLIRGVGPALALFGVSGVLADPQISVVSGTTQLASNDNWETGPIAAAQLSAMCAQVGAFALPAGSKDAALLITLQPGAYTVVLTGVGNTAGVALIEVYDTQ